MTKFAFDDYQFDTSDGCLRKQSSHAEITLRPQVGKLLQCLLDRQGQVVDRETLCLAIWGEGAVVDFESGLAAVVKELRQSLVSVGGSAELLETVPRRGYRLHAKPAQQKTTMYSSYQLLPLRGLVVIGLVLISVLVVGVLMSLNSSRGPHMHTMAILPFEVYGELTAAPEHANYLIADTLLAQLWQAELPGLELIGRSSILPYSDQENVALSVANELDASLIIEGDLIAEADGWRVEARLLELPGGRVIWSASHQMSQ
ncbi:MAG: winged helix-turn-helix domain-containing protein, partial [Pseudomonadota bacterium]